MGKPPAGVDELIHDLTRSWNQGDSKSFSEQFVDDASLVNVHGMRVQGRAAIAGMYDMLFRSVFLRSHVSGEIRTARRLCDNAFVLDLRVGIHAPAGSMAGDHEAVCSLVVERRSTRWQVAAMHNSLVSMGMERMLVA